MKWPLSKRDDSRQTSPSKNGDTHTGTLWAICRRLQARVTELESQTATMRRDINRIDRKGYREIEATKEAQPLSTRPEEYVLPVNDRFKHLFE